MSLLQYLYIGIAAVGGFFAGSLIWAAGTGAVAGILDAVGIILPATTLLAAGPVAGLIGAGASAWKVAT